MKKFTVIAVLLGMFVPGYVAFAQDSDQEEPPTVLTLEQAVQIALSENMSVKVADKEIERTEYARKGAYASLFPQIDASASYSRTIKKQVMYMDFDMGAIGGGGAGEEGAGEIETKAGGRTGMTEGGGIEVGRWNTYSTGVT
ncbi:MAG: TolC family protein, partial [Bacteroidia bacterium]|nr:TolC family protein [Bacteroidia bacterium]